MSLQHYLILKGSATERFKQQGQQNETPDAEFNRGYCVTHHTFTKLSFTSGD
jgi:hypothetical protein